MPKTKDKDPVNVAAGAALEDARLLSRLTAREVVEQLPGVRLTAQSWQNWAYGNNRPSTKYWPALSRILKIDVPALYGVHAGVTISAAAVLAATQNIERELGRLKAMCSRATVKK